MYVTFPNENAPTPVVRTQLLKTFETIYFLSHNWYFGFLYNPSIGTIDLFTLPLFHNKIHASLYDTTIEKTINDINIFKNVDELSLFLSNSNENIKLPDRSFSYVKNLKLISRYRHNERPPTSLFVDISHLITFAKLESIEFIGNYFPSTTFILLDYTTNLKSISISFNSLNLMTKTLNEPHICQRLKTLIKHLTIK